MPEAATETSSGIALALTEEEDSNQVLPRANHAGAPLLSLTCVCGTIKYPLHTRRSSRALGPCAAADPHADDAQGEVVAVGPGKPNSQGGITDIEVSCACREVLW